MRILRRVGGRARVRVCARQRWDRDEGTGRVGAAWTAGAWARAEASEEVDDARGARRRLRLAEDRRARGDGRAGGNGHLGTGGRCVGDRWRVVQESGTEHDGSTSNEGEGDGVVEQSHGSEERDDDGQRRSKALPAMSALVGEFGTHIMLSLYRMTMAVIKPPRVCVRTVPMAHPLKFANLLPTLASHDISGL